MGVAGQRLGLERSRRHVGTDDLGSGGTVEDLLLGDGGAELVIVDDAVQEGHLLLRCDARPRGPDVLGLLEGQHLVDRGTSWRDELDTPERCRPVDRRRGVGLDDLVSHVGVAGDERLLVSGQISDSARVVLDGATQLLTAGLPRVDRAVVGLAEVVAVLLEQPLHGAQRRLVWREDVAEDPRVGRIGEHQRVGVLHHVADQRADLVPLGDEVPRVAPERGFQLDAGAGARRSDADLPGDVACSLTGASVRREIRQRDLVGLARVVAPDLAVDLTHRDARGREHGLVERGLARQVAGLIEHGCWGVEHSGLRVGGHVQRREQGVAEEFGRLPTEDVGQRVDAGDQVHARHLSELRWV